MFDPCLVAADEEVQDVDVVNVCIAVVQVDVDVPGRLFQVEMQQVPVLEQLHPLGVADGDWLPSIDGFLADRSTIDLPLLACGAPYGAFLTVDRELDYLERFG